MSACQDNNMDRYHSQRFYYIERLRLIREVAVEDPYKELFKTPDH